MEIYERMFNSTVRIERAWPFPVSPACDDLAEALEDNEDRLPPEIAALIKGWSEEEREPLFMGASYDFQEAFNELCGTAFRRLTSGWLGIAAVPVFTPHSRGGCSFSWGHYKTKLMFAPSADALLVAACEWAEAEYQAATGAKP